MFAKFANYASETSRIETVTVVTVSFVHLIAGTVAPHKDNCKTNI